MDVAGRDLAAIYTVLRLVAQRHVEWDSVVGRDVEYGASGGSWDLLQVTVVAHKVSARHTR